MKTDPYFATQDNGAGAPIHFAVTYKQLDMIAHLLDLGAEINQQDDKVRFRARQVEPGRKSKCRDGRVEEYGEVRPTTLLCSQAALCSSTQPVILPHQLTGNK